jgi:uroporphyrinogen-III synthase
MTYKKYVVITRPELDQDFSDSLEKLGFNICFYPTIKITKKKLDKKEIEKLGNLEIFDWVLFTSRNGVKYFLEILNELGIDFNLFKGKIGLVGPETAQALKENHLNYDFIPTKFATQSLARQIPVNKGEKVFLPRAEIASSELVEQLTGRGVEVTRIDIYQTEFVTEPNPEFEQLLENSMVAFITFTSPSTVQGFIKSLDTRLMKVAQNIPVLSIGPVTTAFLKENGFKKIIAADVYTTKGMLQKLKETL